MVFHWRVACLMRRGRRWTEWCRCGWRRYLWRWRFMRRCREWGRNWRRSKRRGVQGPAVRVVTPISAYQMAGIDQTHAAGSSAWLFGAAVGGGVGRLGAAAACGLVGAGGRDRTGDGVSAALGTVGGGSCRGVGAAVDFGRIFFGGVGGVVGDAARAGRWRGFRGSALGGGAEFVGRCWWRSCMWRWVVYVACEWAADCGRIAGD